MFQIRKCNDQARRCDVQFPLVPDPVMSANKQHYIPFDDALGKDTTDADRASAHNHTVTVVAEDLHVFKV